MVSTHPLISKFFSPCTNPLVSVPIAPITIGITVTFMFHNFFQFPSKVEVLILLYAFFQFYSVVSQDKVYNLTSSFFFLLLLLIITRLSDPFGSQIPDEFVSHSPRQMLDYAYTICLYGLTSVSCTIPNGSPCPPSHVWSYTLSVLICCIIIIILLFLFIIFIIIIFICHFDHVTVEFSVCISPTLHHRQDVTQAE